MQRSLTAERRQFVRVAGSYPVVVTDHRHRPVGRGKTANLSEHGLFVLLPGGRNMSPNEKVHVEMELPRSPDMPRLTRKVRYRARVVRIESMGSWRGVALELLDKLA